jgi:methyltransferase (TIGR00027 family)
MSEPTIQHISDTARWAATYRARENDRPDAVFRDPLACRLAGERGEQIARAAPFHEKNSWSWVTRTYLFDRLINEQVRLGTDMVVNLAAGLDARPYRMQLPASLKWIEVDLPGILQYKEELLKAEKPVCSLQRVSLDLSKSEARRSFLGSLSGTRALVVTEGLLVYLRSEEVASLATDLRNNPLFQRWALDIVSPGLLRMLLKNTQQQFRPDVSSLKFAPEDGPAFFARYGWKPVEVHSILRTAANLKRLRFFLRLASLFPEHPTRMGSKPWSGVCLLGPEQGFGLAPGVNEPTKHE